MNQDSLSTCYVSSPSGIKHGPSGESIDFDRIYMNSIKPLLEKAGYIAVRADSLITSGTVHKAILEKILSSDVMIADITTLNPDVLYELGVRHGVKKNGTILICSDDTRPPFNTSHLNCIFYHLIDGTLKKEHAKAFRGNLLEALKQSRRTDIVDSPLYEYFPSLSVELSDSIKRHAKSKKENIESLRGRLVEARRMLPAESVHHDKVSGSKEHQREG